MIIALLGAESTGKSTLAAALHRHLQAAFTALPAPHAPPPITHVPEYLRDWCTQHGRTPRADEQVHIAHTQAQWLTGASHPHSPRHWLIADTTPLMTAVYSDHYFGDTSLYALAQGFHAAPRLAEAGQALAPTQTPDTLAPHLPPLNLLMGLDLPWQADGSLRDGPATQMAIDTLLRQQMDAWQLPYQTVYGTHSARVAAALQAIAGHLKRHAPTDTWVTALQDAIEKEANNAMNTGGKRQKNRTYSSHCDCCDDPACERQTFSRLVANRPAAPGSVRP